MSSSESAAVKRVRMPLKTTLGIAGVTLGLALLAGAGPASAQKITVWSGYPEMEPFYRHVAEGMKAKFPNLQVSIEAIPLREHEKRVALGLSSGGAGNLIIELPPSTASRYLSNDLLPKAPANVAAFVSDPKNFDPFFRASASFGGAVYGVPLFRGQGALFYNTEMFKAAGLTRPPATMEEYTEFAEKLTKRDASGKATVSGWSMRLSGGGQGIAEKFWINMFQYGGNLLT
ncbi:MAG: extracellular solute-binding protein, partial [Hyphomicrobiales bacterium]|nr:extracellular solute-binding protein [Hyphomicrobiales bacterium]